MFKKKNLSADIRNVFVRRYSQKSILRLQTQQCSCCRWKFKSFDFSTQRISSIERIPHAVEYIVPTSWRIECLVQNYTSFLTKLWSIALPFVSTVNKFHFWNIFGHVIRSRELATKVYYTYTITTLEKTFYF